ncbi:MAG: hypothetical protein FJ271_13240 [Planctomycetes bacterium]|nr:hypothetical protein [Planctomycetota bacterium]
MSLSEDPYSAFYVDLTDDSIGSCLANVERCDVVVCAIDQRYGGVLKKGACAGLSASRGTWSRSVWFCSGQHGCKRSELMELLSLEDLT